jgi:hypothetical protein
MTKGSLLNEKRLRVHPDGRIEGVATLQANENAAPGKSQGRRVSLVAGARYVRVCALPVALELPIGGHIAA